MSTTFLASVLAYPVLLAALCVGAGLLVDRASPGFLPGALLPVVGAAGLIAVSQLTTYFPAAAPATPFALAGVAAAGCLLGWRRGLGLLRRAPGALGPLGAVVVAYLVALAPVLLSGRLTFSGYGVLPDSALHMIGADYLIRHGQDYAGLDLRNSYGQYITAYFGTSYPSGTHTFFGGSARLLDLPLIWALQPFCAFILATAAGPAWILARRVGLTGILAGLAAVTVTVPALVYGYELVASLKEVTALPLILALGALVVESGWLRGRAVNAVPFALVVAAGVSVLGVAFGAWAVAAAAVLLAAVVGDARSGRRRLGRALPVVGVGLLVGLVAAWPTWNDAYGSLQVATGIASTSNPGNLTAPLHLEQVFGTWLSGSYRHRAPMGPTRIATYVLIAFMLTGSLLGIGQVIRSRAWALAGWLGLLLGLWIGLSLYGTTWADAKLLMLTSPLVVLLAWAGVAALRASPLRPAGALLALVIAGGVLASDAVQYHSTDLAPTDRYDEMAAVNARFAGRGPVLFTDFDEWSLYALRNLDVGGPDFIFPPVGLTRVAHGHGDPVDLDKISPSALRAYPLIMTRRDPTASRPPAAYRLAYEGSDYQVWTRRPGVPAALAHLRLSGTRSVSCRTLRPLARLAGSRHLQLVSAKPVDLVAVDLNRGVRTSWLPADAAPGLVMTRHGSLVAPVRLPRAGVWNVWLRGEVMPTVRVAVDGRRIGAISAEVSGSVFNQDTTTPIPVALAAGAHTVTISRGGLSLRPGDGGSALLHGLYFTPDRAQEAVSVTRPAGWRSLCGGRYDWVEVAGA